MSSLPWAIRLSNYVVNFGLEGITIPWADAGLGVAVFTGDYELRKLTLEFSRLPTGAGIPQDAAMCTFHLLNLTDGDPDDTWTEGDFSTCEDSFESWWTNLSAFYCSDIELSKYVWRKDGPAYKPFGASLSPTVRAVDASIPGVLTSDDTLPPQVAVSVTEVTAAQFTVEDVEGVGTQVRNRWGRFYLPPPASDVNASGRISSTFAAAVSDATAALYTTLLDHDFVPVMYSPTTGSSWSVDAIHVDDIFDVIRRRRFEGPLSRHSNDVPSS